MVHNENAQEWLDKKYPINGTCQRNSDQKNKNKTRAKITELDISKGNLGKRFYSTGDGDKNLVGSLKLEGFTNLRKLMASSHELTGLDVSDCPNLEELDRHNNELNNNNLNVSGCSNLKNIDCSNNNLSELNFGTCPKLEVVNINNNPNLAIDKIKSDLVHDAEKGKLVKDDFQAKDDPQITKAKEDVVRNILMVGWTSNGKSNLANVLTGTNQFVSGCHGVSVTESFKKSEIFEWQGKKYRVIDNIGFGDTSSLSKEDLLFKIGQGICSAKEGINQILFVIKGRFSEEQIRAFKMFKDFVAE